MPYIEGCTCKAITRTSVAKPSHRITNQGKKFGDPSKELNELRNGRARKMNSRGSWRFVLSNHLEFNRDPCVGSNVWDLWRRAHSSHHGYHRSLVAAKASSTWHNGWPGRCPCFVRKRGRTKRTPRSSCKGRGLCSAAKNPLLGKLCRQSSSLCWVFFAWIGVVNPQRTFLTKYIILPNG